MRRIDTMSLEIGDDARKVEIKIYELQNKDIIGIGTELMSLERNKADQLESFAKKWLPKATSLSIEDLYEMAPSETEVVVKKFLEVNSSFFKTSEKLGALRALEALLAGFISNLEKLWQGLSVPDILGPLNMDTHFSKVVLKPALVTN